MYGLHGKITAQAGQQEVVLAALLRGAEMLGNLEGCYTYIVSRANDDGDAIWVTEVWRSAADHQVSLSHEAIRALITEVRPLIAGMSDRSEFEPVGGKGMPG
jgi:quinol monooxygenase YgiN